MNIAILLPLKEKYTHIGGGAVSILVNTHLKNSKYKKTTRIYGSKIEKVLDSNNFCRLKKKFISKPILLNCTIGQDIFFI